MACTSQRRKEAPRLLPLQTGSLGQASAPLAHHAHFTTWPFHVLDTLLEHLFYCHPRLPQPVGWISPPPGSLPWPRPQLHSTLGNSMHPTEQGPDRSTSPTRQQLCCLLPGKGLGAQQVLHPPASLGKCLKFQTQRPAASCIAVTPTFVGSGRAWRVCWLETQCWV